MNSIPADSTSGGWCIHGVPYGPNWSCAQCGVPPRQFASTSTLLPALPDPWTEERVTKVIELLERIERNTRPPSR